MQADDLDRAYTQLCRTMAEVGEARTPLLLATLCLALISREAEAAPVLQAIEDARRACGV